MTKQVERMLPLYEAKMIHHFDHRWATYGPDGTVRDVTLEEKQDPEFVSCPRYWVRAELIGDRLSGELLVVGVRDITNSTNERTVICTLFPSCAVGNNLPIVLGVDDRLKPRLIAYLSSFLLDFVARPKVGGLHLNFFIANQLPVPPPALFDGWAPWGHDLGAWLDRRVVAMVANSSDVASALQGSVEIFDLDRRFRLRAELDAAIFHLLQVPRVDVDYIMETFPIVKRKDEVAFGTFRTKELILEVYDAMQAAIDSGESYASPFDDELSGASESKGHGIADPQAGMNGGPL